jgi:hypothetical protein
MVYIPIDDQVLESVCQALVHTDLRVVDVLSTLQVYNYESPYYEQAILDRGMLERCPLCNHWVEPGSTWWNLDSGHCVPCMEYSSENQRR